jgi:hypothetical protein
MTLINVFKVSLIEVKYKLIAELCNYNSAIFMSAAEDILNKVAEQKEYLAASFSCP